MALACINLHDPGLQLALNGKLLRTSPGFAVLDRQQLLVGEAALAAARLLPRWTSSRFWWALNTEPLPNGTPQIRHHADLAFAQLEDLWQPIRKRAKAVILCVPSHYAEESLGLLLGMAKECGMPVKGLVDRATLAAAGMAPAPALLHLELHLHGITLARLGGKRALARQTVQTISETGLAALWEKWADLIARQFIQATRFDPMHDAAMEQQLFDRLPGWLQAAGAAGGPAPFELRQGDRTHRINLAPDAVLGPVSPIYAQLAEALRAEAAPGQRLPLLVSHAFTGFPGLADALAQVSGLDLLPVPAEKLVVAATERREEIIGKGDGIAHVVQLAAASGGAAPAEAPQAPAAGEQPTHWLEGGTAHPIGDACQLPGCVLRRQGGQLLMEPHGTEDKAGKAALVNGKALAGARPLALGDRVTLDGRQITMIRVAADG